MAVASTHELPLATNAFTVYGAAGVAKGTSLVMMTEPLDDGDRVGELWENVVVQWSGRSDDRLKFLGEQDTESLSVTISVYVTASPAYALAVVGEMAMLGDA